MQKKGIPWMCHVLAALYGSRNQPWQESRVFRKIKIQRLDELTAKRSSDWFHQWLSRWKRAARVENSPGRTNRKSLGASTRISVLGRKSYEGVYKTYILQLKEA